MKYISWLWRNSQGIRWNTGLLADHLRQCPSDERPAVAHLQQPVPQEALRRRRAALGRCDLSTGEGYRAGEHGMHRHAAPDDDYRHPALRRLPADAVV